MHIRFWQIAYFFAVTIMVAGCGSPSDADLAASQQQALVATLAAAPTAGQNQRVTVDSVTPVTTATVPPTALVMAATSVATTIPTSAPTEPATALAPAQPTGTPLPPTTTQPSATTKAATSAPTATPLPTAKPTDTPATPLPPTDIPTPPVAPTATPAPVVAHNGINQLTFSELYSGASIEGPVLSDKAKALNGNKIVMTGYMAPPLKPDLDFFVLTKDPMVYCPFCSSAADWPFDIVFVRMASGTVPALTPTQGVRVVGTFQTGTATDAATGFVSQIRIIADTVDVIQ